MHLFGVWEIGKSKGDGLSPKGEKKTSEWHKMDSRFHGNDVWAGMRVGGNEGRGRNKEMGRNESRRQESIFTI